MLDKIKITDKGNSSQKEKITGEKKMTDIKPTTEEIDLIKYSIDLLIHEQLGEEQALLDLIYERQNENRNITIIVTPNIELLISPTDDVIRYGHYIIIKEDTETKYLINTNNIIYIK